MKQTRVGSHPRAQIDQHGIAMHEMDTSLLHDRLCTSGSNLRGKCVLAKVMNGFANRGLDGLSAVPHTVSARGVARARGMIEGPLNRRRDRIVNGRVFEGTHDDGRLLV